MLVTHRRPVARPGARLATAGPSPAPTAVGDRDTERVDEVVIPRTPDGRRSSAALGRAVVAEEDGRRGFLRHFRALVEAGLGPGTSPTGTGTPGAAGYDIAEAGLAAT